MKRFLIILACLTTLNACQIKDLFGSDSEDGDGNESIPSGLPGWYAQDVAQPTDFRAITDAIRSYSLCHLSGSGLKNGAYLLSKNDFIDKDGKLTYRPDYISDKSLIEPLSSSSYPERCELKEIVLNHLSASFIHIVDNNTMVSYRGDLYLAGSSGTRGKDILYRLDGGPVFGELVYCAKDEGTYYTCAQDGNKLYLTSGSIYTISGSSLIPDGGSSKYMKYNQEYVHTDNWSVDANQKETIYTQVCDNFNGWVKIVYSPHYERWYKLISAPQLNYPFFKTTIDVDKGKAIAGNVYYGWDVRFDCMSEEVRSDHYGDLSEMPGTGAVNVMNWDANKQAQYSLMAKTYEKLCNDFDAGKLSSKELDDYKPYMSVSYAAASSAIEDAKANVRFYAIVNGERYYVKFIRWSKKEGFREWDRTTGNLTCPEVHLDIEDNNSGNSGEPQGGGNNPTAATGSENGHTWVDLGLSVKWADRNIGASKPEDFGDYFAWGEIETKTNYSDDTYKWFNKQNRLTKYFTDHSYGNGAADKKEQLDNDDDAAHVLYGGKWRIPTLNNIKELIATMHNSSYKWTWKTIGGHVGYEIVYLSTGAKIFMPAAGWMDGSSRKNTSMGIYWSSTLNKENNFQAYLLWFDKDETNSWPIVNRPGGCSIRPVL